MEFTPEQRAAIATPGHLVVAAGAGSGKTRVLVERYLRLVDEVAAAAAPGDDPFAAVLAVTFTEKAAREMRDRVRRAAAARPGPAGQAYAAAAEAARIGTIHSFCAELLRAQPAESGLDPRFAILDEVEAGALVADAVEEALRSAVEGGADLAALLEEFAPAELAEALAGLLRGGGEVRAALAALPADPPALLARWQRELAAAQAEARAALLAAPAWRAAADTILALAPAAPAADRIGEQVGAIAAWLRAGGPAGPDLAAMPAVNLTGGARKAWGGEEPLAAAKGALRALREARTAAGELLDFQPDPEVEARAAAATLALAGLATAADAAYTRRKQAIDRLDFDDLERRARGLLAAHPHVRARWHRELHAVLVDEFQDTNDDQRAIIYALAGLAEGPAPTGGPAARPAPPSLFVVGDGKQSIYRFRGADVSVFRRVEEELVAWGGARVAMRASFRSHAHLVALVNSLGAGLMGRPGPLAPFEVPFEPLEAVRAAPPHPLAAELHIIPEAASAAAGREAEAAVLADRVAALVRGDEGPVVFDQGLGAWRPPTCGDIAILFRASSAFEPFEAALRARGLPFLTTAGRGYYGRNEVQDLINLLRALDDPGDELALVGALRSPLFALDDATIVALRLAGGRLWEALARARAAEAGRRPAGASAAGEGGPLVDLVAERGGPLAFAATTLAELEGLRGSVGVVELLRAALDRTGYLATISALDDGERRRANVEKLLAAARLAGTRGLRAFSDYLDGLLRAEAREGEAPLEAEGAVRLMTIHRSKGLEFPIVALPDLGRGAPADTRRWLARPAYGLAVAVRRASDDAPLPAALLLARRAEALMERAEGERLLYVALTRAQDYLLLSGPAQRKGGERWIARLAEALGHPWEAGGPPAGGPGALRVYRHDQQ